jgi:hypothetical protein
MYRIWVLEVNGRMEGYNFDCMSIVLDRMMERNPTRNIVAEQLYENFSAGGGEIIPGAIRVSTQITHPTGKQ